MGGKDRHQTILAAFLAGFLASMVGMAGCSTVGDEAPVLFDNVHGDPVDPLHAGPGELSVLIFITVDCPIANGYAPQLLQLFAAYEGRSVDFYLVHVDPDVGPDRARRHAADYGYEGPILLDPTHRLVAMAGAKFTPEAAVFDADGAMHYRGRINNWYGDLGRKRYQASKHELRDAIDAMLAGRAVAVPRTDPVGCEIEPIG